jgi:enamine deaminase RidA (YjgF/YER057c/UK114 family)
MQVTRTVWGNTIFISIRGENHEGSFENLIEHLSAELAECGLRLDDVVFHRLWTRDRSLRERISAPRERLLGGSRKSATSSFVSATHILSEGFLALEMIACKAKAPLSRRVVEFSPPRAYAHYLVQDDWLFLSGMAENAPTMEEQFEAAFAEVERALAQERIDWRSVQEASLFLEKGSADLTWLEDRFRNAVRRFPQRVNFELVDGLASIEKKLEIEIIARLPS